MVEIMEKSPSSVYKHQKLYIKTRISELYKLIQYNILLFERIFFDLINIKSIEHTVTEIYPDDVIRGKLSFIEHNERLRIDNLPEHKINKGNIESSFNRIEKLKATFHTYGVLYDDFGYSVTKSIKAKLNIVLNEALRSINTATEMQLKHVSEAALKTIKNSHS